MTNVDSEGLKNCSKHLMDCPTNSRQMPTELIELEEYLKKLSNYADKFNRKNENKEKEEKIGLFEEEKTLPSCETFYSVKEDIAEERKPIEIVVIPPPEPIAIISYSEKKDFHVTSNGSEIGIYIIQDVIPVHIINVIQRELYTLTDLSPSVGFIVHEMRKEFDHFKVCRSCLKKVLPLLPDVLKELQELIKFVKKKRNESYFWPNDSDYLRKSNGRLSKTAKKDLNVKKIKQTGGKSTVDRETNSPVGESFVSYEHMPSNRSECRMRRYSVRLTDSPQCSIFRSKTENDMCFLEKLETVEKDCTLGGERVDRDESFINEFSTAQMVRILHPKPAVEKAIQLQTAGNISCSIPDGIPEGITTEHDKSDNFAAIKLNEFLMAARVALGDACSALKHDCKEDTEKELKMVVKDLKNLMLEAHKNQIELCKVLLEKGILNSVVVQLTDPKMLYEEKRGIEKAKNCLSDGGRKLENPSVEQLQRLVEVLKRRCNVKNRMIIALLNGLRSNVPRQHWDELISHVLREAGTENLEDFFRQNSTPPNPEHAQMIRRSQEWKARTKNENEVEEILSEREVKRTWERGKQGKEKAKISFSEVISKTSKCLQMTETDSRLRGKTSLPPHRSSLLTGVNAVNSEAEKLLRDLENEVKSVMQHRDQCGAKEVQTVEAKPTVGETLKAEAGFATINLTIKIGNEETMSQYKSAVSFIQSGTTLRGKQSEMSLPCVADRPAIQFTQEAQETNEREVSASKSLTSLVLKLKVPLTFREDGEPETAEINFEKLMPKEIIVSNESKIESAMQSKPDSIPAGDVLLMKASNETLTGKGVTEIRSGTSTLNPQINLYYEQIMTMQKLQTRLRLLEDGLRSLTRTLDRMNVLTEKLADDAYESSENFRDIFNRYSFITDGLRS